MNAQEREIRLAVREALEKLAAKGEAGHWNMGYANVRHSPSPKEIREYMHHEYPAPPPEPVRIQLGDGRVIHYAPHEVPNGYHWRDSGNNRAPGPTLESGVTISYPTVDRLRELASDATACADAMDQYNASRESLG